MYIREVRVVLHTGGVVLALRLSAVGNAGHHASRLPQATWGTAERQSLDGLRVREKKFVQEGISWLVGALKTAP